MILLRLVLCSTISLCGIASAETLSEKVENSTRSSGDLEILDVQTEAEMRAIMREVGQRLLPSDCGDWGEDEPRVAAVIELGAIRELWIGSEYAVSEGLGIEGLQRTYEIKNLSLGGSPFQGSIDIRLPNREMDVERTCFNKLKGVQIKGPNDNGEGIYRNDLWEMTVSEVNFGVLVKPQGLSGERVATGETQVTLALSESLVTMALRKSAEHLWALPGSLILLILWAFGGRVLRKIAQKRRTQSTRGSRM